MSKLFSSASLVIASAMFFLLAVPAFANAASLTNAQASAIVGLLQSFGADQSVILEVEQDLGVAPTTTTTTTTTISTPTPPAPITHAPVIGSAYKSAYTGYDFSYNTPAYPGIPFSFGIVGVTKGKAFTQNPIISQEYAWAQDGGGGIGPTMYVNVNAPYGSTATAANISSPKTCPVTTQTAVSTTTLDLSGTGSNIEPTPCAAYNYGYNTAEAAYTYAQGKNTNSTFWWLDVEDANSWAPDNSVNDQVIQGAIDYLNSQNVRVGIYSMTYMWNEIAGSTFVPTQTLQGKAVTIPNWFPIGITTFIGAANACAADTGFIQGSPIWLIQYENSSTASDQNYAC